MGKLELGIPKYALFQVTCCVQFPMHSTTLQSVNCQKMDVPLYTYITAHHSLHANTVTLNYVAATGRSPNAEHMPQIERCSSANLPGLCSPCYIDKAHSHVSL